MRLIERRDGHRLALDVETAKIALSNAAEHTLRLERIEPNLTCTLTQAQLEAAGAQLVARIGDTLDTVIRDSGVRPDRIESVYLTGGASAMRALTSCIGQRLPAARITSGDTFGSIGVGLAVAAARRYGMVSA